MSSKTLIGKECIHCGKNTLLTCSKCSEPLCENCGKPKKPIQIPFYNTPIPASLCEGCIYKLFPELLNETKNKLNSIFESLRKLFE